MAVVSIDGLIVTEGRLPPRAEAMVIDWATMRQEELRKEWDLARGHKALFRINPLP